jgi:hypothetical protein
MSFPLLDDFSEKVIETLDSRKNNLANISKTTNPWIRIFSGLSPNGMILQSNNTDFRLFSAAGDAAPPSVYGSTTHTGVIGVDWNNKPIYTQHGEQLYRPPPVVTSLTIDEGVSDGLSRKASFSITVFSLAQLDTITKYFSDPGLTIFIEFGFNTPDSIGQRVPMDGINNIKGEIKKRISDFNKITEHRTNSKGMYDCYGGFVTGGSVTNDGDQWTVSVDLRGISELPWYMQLGRKSEHVTPDPAQPFGTAEIDSRQNESGVSEFRVMFNQLPSIFKITAIKKAEIMLAKPENFINFNDKIIASRNNITKIGEYKIPDGSTLISDQKFIRFKLIIDMLNLAMNVPIVTGDDIDNMFSKFNPFRKSPAPSSEQPTSDQKLISIDTSNVIISAFPLIFSTNVNKLFIPNKWMPKFTPSSIRKIRELSTEKTAEVNFIQSLEYSDSSIKLADNPHIEFPQWNRLDTPKKTEAYWGKLDDLYVNFNLFTSIFNKEPITVRTALYSLLNELSSAAGSQWNFQIMEQTDDITGNIRLGIVDLNFMGEPGGGSTDTKLPYTFNMSGYNSIFQNASFDMNISGEMMNKIIAERNSVYGTQPAIPTIGPIWYPPLLPPPVDMLREQEETYWSTEAIEPTVTDNPDEPADVSILMGDVGILCNPMADPGNSEFDKTWWAYFQNKDIAPKSRQQSESAVSNALFFATYNNQPFFDKCKEVMDMRYYNPSWNGGNAPGSKSTSILLPITFSFDIHGISGIRMGNRFKVKGIPEKYEKGIFQVTTVKHSIGINEWKTTVEAGFRVIHT